MTGGSYHRAPIPKSQKGDLNVTNASHIYDCALANKLLPPGTLSRDQKEALDRFLTSIPNLPVKTRSGPGGNFGKHPDSDNVLDSEIMKALGTRQRLSGAAFDRAREKVALVKGLAKDSGLNDESIKALLKPLIALKGPDGTSVDARFPVVFEKGKPANIWKQVSNAETGLKANGEPDIRTRKGRERAASPKTYEQETGLTQSKTASDRTKIGKRLGVPKIEMRAAHSGLKLDGSPDMRTKLGKQIAAEKEAKQARDESQFKTHTANHRELNPWNAFTHAHEGMGLSMQQLSSLYRTQGNVPSIQLDGGNRSVSAPSSFVGSASHTWNGNTSGPVTAAGRPDMRFKANWS